MKNVTNAMRAHILTAAVPYIKQYTDQYVVVKYGGNAMTDEELKRLTNRLNLENNYMNAKNVQSGKGNVESILSIAGGALAVASSAAILYDTIKKFK